MKEPNYVMKIMATDGRLLADNTCNATVRIWNEKGEDVVKNFKYKLRFVRLVKTTTSDMHCHKLRIHG